MLEFVIKYYIMLINNCLGFIMKIKDLFDENQNIEYSVYDYALNLSFNESDETAFVLSLNEVLKTNYIVFTFYNEINNGGLDYFYDVCKFSNLIENALEKIDAKKVLKIIKSANKIILGVEKRLNCAIYDNIEYITKKESSKLQKLGRKFFKFENELTQNLRDYIYNNQDEEI